MKNSAPFFAAGIGLLLTAGLGYAGYVPFLSISGSTPNYCYNFYGLSPDNIMQSGSPVGPSSWFALQAPLSMYVGYGPWQGPQPTTFGLNKGATSAQSWGADPAGSPIAVFTALLGGSWTNPSGGAIAVIFWENTMYSLPAGSYSWTYSTGETISRTTTATTYYDMALFLSGGCVDSTPSSGTTTSTVTSGSTSTSTMLPPTTSSTTLTNPLPPGGGPAPPATAGQFPVPVLFLVIGGIIFLGIGVSMEEEKE